MFVNDNINNTMKECVRDVEPDLARARTICQGSPGVSADDLRSSSFPDTKIIFLL